MAPVRLSPGKRYLFLLTHSQNILAVINHLEAEVVIVKINGIDHPIPRAKVLYATEIDDATKDNEEEMKRLIDHGRKVIEEKRQRRREDFLDEYQDLVRKYGMVILPATSATAVFVEDHGRFDMENHLDAIY